MSRNYKFYDSVKPYFVSYATVGWVDVFTRRVYFDILTESLDYYIANKGLILGAWCIMTSHVHLIIRSETSLLQDIIRDMKKYTSKELVDAISNNPQESRKKWLLHTFRQAGEANSNNKTYQVWQQHNQPIELSTNKMMDQRLDYQHNNPVEAGFVEKPEDWLYSSAKQYASQPGMLNLELIK